MNMKTAAIRLACLATAGVLLAVPLAAGTASFASATPTPPQARAADVVATVGGDSINGKDVKVGDTFLYRYDSSAFTDTVPATSWSMTTKLDTQNDEYTGHWSVYAPQGLILTDQRKPRSFIRVFGRGDRIAGDDYQLDKRAVNNYALDNAGLHFDADPADGLFTATYHDGTVTVQATPLFIQLLGKTPLKGAWKASPWTVYIQCQRTTASTRVENTGIEHVDGTTAGATDTVWTGTPARPSTSTPQSPDPSGQPAGSDGDDGGLPPALLPKRDQGTGVFADPVTVEQALGGAKTGYAGDSDAVYNSPGMSGYSGIGPLPGASLDGGVVNVGDTFLYRYDSTAPVMMSDTGGTPWSMTTKLDTAHDGFTGRWAVYEVNDGKPVRRLAGDGYPKTQEYLLTAATDGSYTASSAAPLFTATAKDGRLTVAATPEFRTWRGKDYWMQGERAGKTSLRVYVQCERVAPGDRVSNTGVEYIGRDAVSMSNTVWTRTPDRTPGLAVKTTPGADTTTVTVTNTGKGGDDGAWIQAGDLRFGNLTDIAYPAGWDTLLLKPGESATLTGRPTGDGPVTASVTPITVCPVSNTDPFDPYVELLGWVPGKGPLGSLYQDGLDEVYFPEAGYERQPDGRWTPKETSRPDTVTIGGVQRCKAGTLTATAPDTAGTPSASPTPDATTAITPPAASPSPTQGKAGQPAATTRGRQLASTGVRLDAALAAMLVPAAAGIMMILARRGRDTAGACAGACRASGDAVREGECNVRDRQGGCRAGRVRVPGRVGVESGARVRAGGPSRHARVCLAPACADIA